MSFFFFFEVKEWYNVNNIKKNNFSYKIRKNIKLVIYKMIHNYISKIFTAMYQLLRWFLTICTTCTFHPKLVESEDAGSGTSTKPEGICRSEMAYAKSRIMRASRLKRLG